MSLPKSDGDPAQDQFVGPPLRGWMLLAGGIAIWFGIQWSWQALQPLPQPLASPAYRVNLNQAVESDLLNLPEVGPSLAKNLIRHREQVGPFRSLADVEKVPGIGPRTLALLAPYLTYELATSETLTAASGDALHPSQH